MEAVSLLMVMVLSSRSKECGFDFETCLVLDLDLSCVGSFLCTMVEGRRETLEGKIAERRILYLKFGLVWFCLVWKGKGRQLGRTSLKGGGERKAKGKERKEKKTKLKKRNRDSSRFLDFRVDGRLRWVTFFLDK